MKFIDTVKGWISMVFNNRAKSEFDVIPVASENLSKYIESCSKIYNGKPNWLDDDISTINFAKSVCSEAARLATLAISVNFDGSVRAEYLQKAFDEQAYFNLRHWVEFGLGYGTVIIKPNGNSIDVFTPDKFIITDYEGDNILGAVFQTNAFKDGKYYTRYEYHRFENGKYAVSNRCFVSKTEGVEGKPISIEHTPWSDLAEDVYLQNVDKPLFGVFRTPQANNIDKNSVYGLPLFSDAITELKDLDIAYSRNSNEIYDSKRTVLLDSDRLMPLPGKGNKIIGGSFNDLKTRMGLPDYVKAISGTGEGDIYHEINPTLETEKRLTGINALLSQIGYKCGFSNGYFVFNEKQGVQTATQVESDDRRTIQLIKDIRDKLEYCINGLVYALDKFADLYDTVPTGDYEIFYDFGDITYNVEEDRARWYSYVVAGKIPFWYYLTKFEGFTEEDAKAIEAQAQPQAELFGGIEE